MTPVDSFQWVAYKNAMEKISLLTPLFSDGETAYIPYRFVERLFAKCANATNIAQSNAVFDTRLASGSGVGVKTFVMNTSANSKFEKVQEFTKRAGRTKLNSLPKKQIMEQVSIYRNASIISDSYEYEIDLTSSIYHCFIRKPGKGLVLEEKYELIDFDSLSPCDKSGNDLSKFDESSRDFFFTDHKNVYSYSKSKSVLMKRFQLVPENCKIEFELPMDPEIWSLYYSGISTSMGLVSNPLDLIGQDEEIEDVDVKLHFATPGKDFVVLPLYATRYKIRTVSSRSGINQWNARGRARKFGEAYIPIPKAVRKSFPDFFPSRFTKFDLNIPGSQNPISVQICQDDGKALMSDPNIDLCGWVYKVIDPNFVLSDLGTYIERKPFTYEDLLKVGKDCVIVSKDSNSLQYEISFGPIGGYEDFLDSI